MNGTIRVIMPGNEGQGRILLFPDLVSNKEAFASTVSCQLFLQVATVSWHVLLEVFVKQQFLRIRC